MRKFVGTKQTQRPHDCNLMPRNKYANSGLLQLLIHPIFTRTTFHMRSSNVDQSVFKNWSIFWFQEDINFSFVTLSDYFKNLRRHVGNSLWMPTCHWLRLEAWPMARPIREQQLQPPLLCQYCGLQRILERSAGNRNFSSMSTQTDQEFLANSLDF